MYFKSRTDLDIVQIPNPIPPMGPAGDIVMDPDFDNLIIRVTDENSITIPKGSNVYAGLGGSADVNVWNTNSTMLYLEDQGGAGAIFGFDPHLLTVKRLFPGWRVPGALVFSKLDPNIAFNFTGRQFLRYDLSDTSLQTPPAPVVVCDFSSQIPGAATWQTIGGVEAADTVFTAAFSVAGPQGTGVYACSYFIGQGYRTYNTATGIITGDFGPTGPIAIPDRFTIHNVKCSKDGTTLIIGVTTKMAGNGHGPFFWTIASGDISPLPILATGGHWTGGYGEYLNNSNTAKIPNWAHVRRPFNNLDSVTQIANPVPTPSLMYGIDDHLSYNGAQNGMMVSISTSNPSKPAPYPAAWWDEVLGFDLSENGKVYRFCHHFSDTHNGTFGETNAIGAVDQLNTFVAFTSNWQKTLANGRCDVFVVKLR